MITLLPGRQIVSRQVDNAAIALGAITTCSGRVSTPRKRSGVNLFGRHYPASIYKTSDGWLGVSTVTHAQWTGMCQAFGLGDIAEDPKVKTHDVRLKNAAQLDAALEPVIATKTSDEWFWICNRLKLPVVIVPRMDQLLQQKAAHFGIVNEVVPRDQLMAEATRWAEMLLEIPPMYTKAIKVGHYRDMQLRYLQNEYDYVDYIHPQEVSEDRQEALEAFFEKRKPTFQNR
ncbi:CoA transferase [Pseudooceanicola sp.]|uniref:CoA transferase n=1 Tax=Pseudooceanicola sp. TaxID=1914328 RepID=UPI002614E190|nr:CoA transferase [Pseudooceanicola sp.]MDF1855056.1 CoA transferase [Pseudooceanicola sp.]